MVNHKEKERSRIDWNAFDLWGIAAIGDTFICGGGVFLMSSHKTIFACLHFTFLSASCLKCSSASADIAEACDPRATASQISSFFHGALVFVGHPYVANSHSRAPAGWFMAKPRGHIEFLCSGHSSALCEITMFP